MNGFRFSMILLAAAITAAGCSSKGGAKGDGEGADAAVLGADGTGGPQIGKYGEGSGGAYGSGGSAGRYGSGGAGSLDESALDDPNSPLAKRVIYFGYDSSDVLPEYVKVINDHAQFVAANPERRIVLEGHADERGSAEYNIALGEQRAKAVQKMMQLQGVNSSQVQVVSFGEEKPADSGHDESAYQQNRRVEISYPGH